MPLQAVDTGFDSPHSSDERFTTPRGGARAAGYLSSGDEWSKNSARGSCSESDSSYNYHTSNETPRYDGYSSAETETYYHCNGAGGSSSLSYCTTPYISPTKSHRRLRNREAPAQPAAQAIGWSSDYACSSSDEGGYTSQEYSAAYSGYEYDQHTLGVDSQHHGGFQYSGAPEWHGAEQQTGVAKEEWGEQYQHLEAAESVPGSYEGQVEELCSFARHNRVAEIQQLLSAGVSANSRDKNGNTVLSIACQNGNKKVAKAALRHGADINSQNDKGNTPLHFCFAYGFGETLGQYLISKGADTMVRNRNGFSCYEGLNGGSVNDRHYTPDVVYTAEAPAPPAAAAGY